MKFFSVVFSTIFFLSTQVNSAPILDSDEEYVGMIEVFMDSQAANVSLLARGFGYDPFASNITFEGIADENTNNFSFNAIAGSNYLGRALELSVTGIYDSTGENRDITSSGQVGMTSFTGLGLATVATWVGQTPKAGKSDWDFDLFGSTYDYHSTTKLIATGAGISSVTDFEYTIDNAVVSKGKMRDTYTADGKWEWRVTNHELVSGNVTPDFYIESNGYVERLTGQAGFTTSTSRIPEPSLFLLLTISSFLVIYLKNQKSFVA